MNGDSRLSRAECADECRRILQPEEKSPEINEWQSIGSHIARLVSLMMTSIFAADWSTEDFRPDVRITR